MNRYGEISITEDNSGPFGKTAKIAGRFSVS